MNENIKLCVKWWGLRVENVGGMKMENYETNPKNPDIALHNCPPRDTETRTRDLSMDRTGNYRVRSPSIFCIEKDLLCETMN